MDAVLDVASWICIVLGGAFVVIGAIGMVRMPDFYTRMHAASVIDTLGAGLLILGMILQIGFDLIALKLVFVFALLFFIGPVAAHALAQAALHAGVTPLLHEDRRGRLSGGDPASATAEPQQETP